MKKEDEIELWNKVKGKPLNEVIEWERIGQRLGMPMKRLGYILDKWTNKGILNYGISLRTAWIEDKTKWRDEPK